MENILFIVGAGFSKPLGLPLMSTFIEKAKNLRQNDPENYDIVDKLDHEIIRAESALRLLNVDLFNIEEVLSILETEDHIFGNEQTAGFQGIH